ncbi:MAG: TetR/AcrR family transcriptional regulator [Micromonosporaceae bacterium]
MARPPKVALIDIVRAARGLFWDRGYAATSLSDLEQRTGLNRSSLYQHFGSKQGLFHAALGNYLDEVAEPRLADLESPDAGLPEVVGYLRALADSMRTSPHDSSRGCLMVNTITELADRDPDSRALGARYRQRLTEAFGNALARAAAQGEIHPDSTSDRANLLTGAVIGVLATAHLSHSDAAALASAAADQVAQWTGAERAGS